MVYIVLGEDWNSPSVVLGVFDNEEKAQRFMQYHIKNDGILGFDGYSVKPALVR